MKNKFLMKSIIFFAIFVLIFVYSSNVLRSKQLSKPWDFSMTTSGFYNEKRNTLDVLAFGSSHAYASINPIEIWDKTGIPSYVLATSNQPIWITYYYMKEALKFQKPKVMILDVHMIVDYDKEYGTEAMNYTALNEMKFSKNKVDAIRDSVPKQERVYYYFDLFKYHSRWKEISKYDFDLSYKKKKNKNKGMIFLDGTKPIKNYKYPNTKKERPLPKKTELYLNKIIKLAKDNNIKLLLIKAPNNPNQQYVESLNTVENIAKHNDIPFINYNKMYRELKIDEEKDFYDPRHLNYIGAKKLSNNLAQYLKENYNLENKKFIKAYEGWS